MNKPDPRLTSIKDFYYPLPDERIARYPLPERDASRLLIYEAGAISEDIYRNLSDHIPTGHRLVFNDSKVVAARLIFHKPTGGTIEIFCIEPHEEYGDITHAMLQKEKVRWLCLVGGASKWKHGQVLQKQIETTIGIIELQARFIEKRPDLFLIELNWQQPGLSFAELLHLAGETPLPPYLKREAESSDTERYQTVYAVKDGSVAAPTAGLHFTPAILESLQRKNIPASYLTLHVGAGTFKPVKADTMQEHIMHLEWIEVSRNTISELQQGHEQIIAVGTTSLRTLESLYWLGVQCSLDPGRENAPSLSQWDAYELPGSLSTPEALKALLTWMDKRKMDRLVTTTQLLVAPGYQFRLVKGLITNFHQPESTLLLLVAALIGDDWKKVYDYALREGFRFLSYGDGSLLWRN